MLACRLLGYNFRYDIPIKKVIKKNVGADAHKLRTMAGLTGTEAEYEKGWSCSLL
jgi:hypothetical protein